MIEIHHIFPSRSLRIIWLLEELGVDYTLRPLTWPVRETHPEYLAISPAGTFPAVTIGDETWLESMAICELLARGNGGEALLVAPDDPGYARYLQWLWFGEATLLQQLTDVMRYGPHMPEALQIPRAVAEAADAYGLRLDALEAGLDNAPFVAGARLSLADLSIGYALFMGDRILGQGDRFGPRTRVYWQGLLAREPLQRAIARAAPAA